MNYRYLKADVDTIQEGDQYGDCTGTWKNSKDIGQTVPVHHQYRRPMPETGWKKIGDRSEMSFPCVIASSKYQLIVGFAKSERHQPDYDYWLPLPPLPKPISEAEKAWEAEKLAHGYSDAYAKTGQRLFIAGFEAGRKAK